MFVHYLLQRLGVQWWFVWSIFRLKVHNLNCFLQEQNITYKSVTSSSRLGYMNNFHIKCMMHCRASLLGISIGNAEVRDIHALCTKYTKLILTKIAIRIRQLTPIMLVVRLVLWDTQTRMNNGVCKVKLGMFFNTEPASGNLITSPHSCVHKRNETAQLT